MIVPIYEYLCRDCSHKFELKQSMKDEAVATCDRCGKSVSRIISSPAIMFKGTGWYVTDYSDKLKPPAGESSSTDTPPKKDTKETAAGSTPAAPAPAASGATSTSSSTNSTSAPSTPSGTTSSSGNSSSST